MVPTGLICAKSGNHSGFGLRGVDHGSEARNERPWIVPKRSRVAPGGARATEEEQAARSRGFYRSAVGRRVQDAFVFGVVSMIFNVGATWVRLWWRSLPDNDE